MSERKNSSKPEQNDHKTKIEGPTSQHDKPVLTKDEKFMINLINYSGSKGPDEQSNNPTFSISEDEKYIINFIESGGVEDPHEQSNNSILSEDDKYIIRVITSGGIEGPGRRRVNPILTEKQEAAWRE